LEFETIETFGLRDAVVPHVQHLSPTLRRAADFVLQNPDVVAMHSLRQVAAASELKPPSFTRLSKSLGLENYEELRELCRREVQGQQATFADKAAALLNRKGPKAGSFLISHAAAGIANIEKMLAGIDTQVLAAAADLLASSRSVVLVGSMSSAPLVDYLGYMATMALPNWRVALRNQEPVSVTLRGMGRRDSVLVLTHKPYARASVLAARRAAELDVPVIAVTDSFTAPVAGAAQHVFIVPTESPHFFASEVALILFFEALLGMVVRRSGNQAQRRIAHIEQENHRSGEYWQGEGVSCRVNSKRRSK
jgi:DNA-binding MurR/RpiR family transcriptional regulator